jgi:hypothetical protein
VTRRAVFDHNGDFMLWASEDYVLAALRRGELEEDENGALKIIPKPIRVMTPQEKRNYERAKERAKK